jgi:hypothetical protein
MVHLFKTASGRTIENSRMFLNLKPIYATRIAHYTERSTVMQNSEDLLKKTTFIAALVLVVLHGMPVPSFAFRNPNQDPQEIVQPQGPASIQQNGSSAAGSPVAEPKSTGKVDTSGNEAAAVLTSGEVGMASPAAATLLKTSGFQAFNSSYGNQWQATFSTETGRVKRLYGSESRPYSGTPENAAGEFLKSAHALFGLKADLSDLRVQKAGQTPKQQHVRFQQTLNGVDVQGAQIIVHSDLAGRVTMVQNNCLEGIEPVNQDVLTLEAARDIAENDLSAKLGSQATLLESSAKKLLIPGKGHYLYIWKISIPTRNPLAQWVYHVDAANGKILYSADEVFYLQDGTGQAYLNNDQRWLDKISKVKLYDLYTTEDAELQGFLKGLRASVYDDTLDYAYAPNLNFSYAPSTEKVYFDQAQAYYQHIAAWEWWNKNVIKKYGPGNMTNFNTLSLPVIVNVAEMTDESGTTSQFCNAGYYNPGYDDLALGLLPAIVYGNENTCPWMNEDFVVDTDIVRHEYTHAIMDWAGPGFAEQFGGYINGYGRAMGEGNADWYAFLASGKPSIAYVTFAPDGLRNINNNRRYPYDVDYPDFLYPTDNASDCGGEDTALPENHYTGEIWGGYLHDLSRVLGKSALKFIYPSSFYFYEDGGHRDGYPDFVDAIRAQKDAEFAETGGKNKQFLKAFGSMVSRGFIRALPDSEIYESCNYFGTGADGEDERDYLALEAPLKLKTRANMLVSGDKHEYPFEALEGMLLTAKVSAKTGALKAPVIQLYTISGTLLKEVSYSSNQTVTNAALTYILPADGTYVVRVTGLNSRPAQGHYTFELNVKAPKIN